MKKRLYLLTLLMVLLGAVSVQAQSKVYMSSTAGEPWGQNDNITCMTAIFGSAGYTHDFFETVSTSTMLANASFIFIDGSDRCESGYQTWIASNASALQTWVSGGGHLFINCAPQQTSHSLGFGITSTYPSFTGTAVAVSSSESICTTPFSAGSSWTGSAFAHAYLTGSGFTTLIYDQATNRPDVAVMTYGSGQVLFGTMTMPFFHQPNQQAFFLRENIIYNVNNGSAVGCTGPAVTTNPSASTVCANSSASFTVAGSNVTSYQWQESQNSGGSYSNLSNAGIYSGVTTATLGISSAASTMNGFLYRCVLTGACGSPATSGSASLTVNTAPAFTTCPSNMTVGTSAISCSNTVTYTAIASGSPAPTYTYTLSGATSGSGSGTGSGLTFNKGVTTVSITASNTCNTANCSFTVTMNDNTPPVARAKNLTTNVSFSGSANITTALIDNGSSDNCGAVTLSLSKTHFTCADYGNNTVTLTATDASNNTNSTDFIVTINAPYEAVTGNGNAIANGATTTSSTNNTDFGSTPQGVAVTKTFTISDTGNSTIVISGITFSGTNASDFTVVSNPSSAFAAGTSTSFTVQFTPSTASAESANIIISSSSCNNNTYTFALSGTGLAPATGLNFSGSGEYVSLNTSVGNFGAGDFTIQMHERYSGSDLVYLYSKRSDCAGGGNFISMQINGGVAQMETDDNSNNYSVLTGSTKVNDGKWHELTITRKSNVLTLYVDGTKDGSTTSLANLSNNAMAKLGSNVCVFENQSVPYYGDMDEVRFWSRALCQAEINNNLSCELGGTQTNLVAYYKLNEGYVNSNNTSVTSVTDASGNSNTGTLQSFGLTGTSSNWVAGTVSGTCSTFTNPIISLSGNGNSISNGATASTTTKTDFGSTVGGTITETYTIQNTGNGSLTVSSIVVSGTGASSFTVGSITTPATVATSSSTTFTVTFSSAVAATYNATVTVNSNDCNTPIYTFAVKAIQNCTVPSLSSQPSPVTVCAGTNATFFVTVSGTGIGYQWLRSTDGGNTFSNISGATSNVYTEVAPSGTFDNYQYKVTVTGTCGTVTSSAATLRVNSIVSASVANQTACSGTTATFSVSVTNTGPGTLRYQWTDNGSNISGATSSSYSLTTSPSLDGHSYVPTISSGGCSVFTIPSGVMAYQIYSTHAGNGSTTQYSNYAGSASDMDAIYNTGNSNTVLKSSGTISPSVGLNWSSASTLTSAGISIPNGGDYFAAEFTGTFVAKETGTYSFGIGSDDASDLQINGTMVAGDYGGHGVPGSPGVTGSISLTAGTSYSFRARQQEYNGGEGLFVVWKRPSQSTYSLQTGEINAQGILSVNSVTAASVANQTTCAGTNATFTVTAITSTGPATLSYQWQISTDGVNYTNITSATNSSFTVTAPASTANGSKYRCMVQSDGCTPFASTSGTLTVNAPPVFTACPSNINANTSTASCNAVVSYTATVTSTPAGTISYVFTGATTGSGSGTGSGNTFNKGTTTVTISAINTCGSATPCSFTITVTDNVKPVMAVKNATINLDASGNASITTANINNGSSDNCGAVSLSLDKTSFTCANLGANTVTLTATDGSSNSNSATATVTVVDNIAPTVSTRNVTISLDATGHASIGTADIDNGSTDNCSFTLSLDKTSFDCSNVGNNTVTLTATDGSNNVSTGTATVTVIDNIKPTVKTQSITVYLDATGAAAIKTSDVDNGSFDNCHFTLSLDKTTFDCSNTGANTVTLTATDASNNTSSSTATVTVVDNIKPTVITQDIVINLDANGAATIKPSDVDNGSSDNCTFTLSLDKASFDCSNTGDNTVTLTATDASNNTTSATATVTVKDITAPNIVTQGVTVYLDANGSASIKPSDVDGGTTDNCSFTLSLDISTFSCNDLTNSGSGGGAAAASPSAAAKPTSPASPAPAKSKGGKGTTVTLTATDPSGNTSSDQAIVTVLDAIAPTASAKNITVYLDANGQVNIAPSDVDNGSTDNCSVASLALDVNSFTCSNLGDNTVTLTVTDGSGNTSTATATVTVKDLIAPTVVTQNVVIYLDANGKASTTAAAVDNGSYDNCTVASTKLDKCKFDCSNLGDNTVTLTVTDQSGNASTATATVTVKDIIAPTATAQNVTIYLDANGKASTTASAVNNGSTDNCTIASLALDKTDFTCSNLGDNTVTLTVTDQSSNASTATATVTVKDAIAPTVITQNVVIYLDGSGKASTTATAVDNGSYDNCTVASIKLDKCKFDCSNLGDNTVTLTVTDQSGNASTATATVTVKDAIAPTATAQNVVINLDANGKASTTATAVNNGSTDNCTIASLALDKTDFNCSNLGDNTVTLTVTDQSSNASTTTATVTVKDLIAPTVITQNVVIYLDATGKASTTATAVNNGSHDNCTVASIKLDKCKFDCSNLGDNTVTLTVTDQSSNVSTATATVTVKDVIAPTATAQNVVIYLDANGKASTTASAVNNGSTDNCTIASLALSKTDFTCSNLGDNTVTLTVTDQSGNASTATATVTVKDAIAPTVITQTVSIYLDSYGKASTTASAVNNGSYDNCSIASMSLDKTDFTCSNLGDNTVTLTVTDEVGNVSTATATVTVIDNISPKARVKNLQVYLDANGQASITTTKADNGSYDNCSFTLSLDKTSFNCSNLGSNTITLTATDGSGNYGYAMGLVYVNDNISPTVITKNVTVYLDASGNASIGTSDINNGSYDNCSVAKLALDKTSFNCSNTGVNTVTLTVTDQSGNSSSATATVTVIDNTKPTVSTKNITVYLDGNGKASITPSSVDNGSYDNCSFNLSIDKNSFTCANEGANTVTLTATDASNNVTSATATVTVVDNTKPTVLTKNISIKLNASNAASISVSDINNGSYDNCTIVSIVASKTSFDCSNVGANTVTLTVTDNSGNVNTGTATVTVIDPYPPVAKAKNITVYLGSNGSVTVDPASVNNGSTDNCTMIFSLSKSTFSCSNIGKNTVTFTVTDGSGNTATATATITVLDNTAPTIKVQNVTVYIGSNGKATLSASQLDNGTTDNCAYVLAFDHDGDEWSNPNEDDLYKNYSCNDIGNHTVTVYAIDKSYNYSYASVTVTVKDAMAPTVVTKNYTAYLDHNGSATVSVSNINNGSYDNCGIASTVLSKTSFSCANLGANTVTLTVTDNSGNVSTGTATVTIVDNTAPTAIVKNITVNLDGNGSATIGANDVNNGSYDNCTIASMSLSKTSFSCSDIGNTTVRLTVTDGSGNVATANATVTVKDNTAPTIKAKNVTVTLDATGKATLNASALDNGSSDNCGYVLAFDHDGDEWSNPNDDDLYKTFTCSNVGANSVTVYAIDKSNNYSAATVTVTVIDNIAPTVKAKNITVYLGSGSGCHSDGSNAVITPSMVDNGSSDNCSVSLSLDKTTFDCSSLGANTVTLTAKDPSGNTSTTTATVTVKDNTAPHANAQDMTVTLDGSGNASITAAQVNSNSYDNCSIASMSLSKTSFTCANVGRNTVTLTVTDPSGNSSVDYATITVVDNTAPTAKTKNITVSLDANGQVSIVPSQIDNGSSDNCSVALTFGNTTRCSSDNKTMTFNCNDIGTIQVTLRATDPSGNYSTSNAMVTVVDNSAPVVITKNISVTLSSKGAATIKVSDIDKGSYDNCSIASESLDKTTFSCANVGANTVTLTVKDPSGNTSTGTAIVTVKSSLSVDAGSETTVYYGYSPLASASLSATASGGGGSYSYKWSTSAKTSSITVSPTATTVYYVTVTDANGCTATDSVQVDVIDVRCGTSNSGVSVCKSGSTSCVSSSDVPAYLKKGYTMGSCNHLAPVMDMTDQYGMTLSAYPNPFTENTTISFTVADPSQVTVVLYNLKGEKMQELFNNSADRNNVYTIDLQSSYLAPGVYMVRLTTGSEMRYIKLIKLN